MIVRFNQTLILLLVISKLMSSALFGQNKVDYFEDNPFADTERAHLLPRKASFLEAKEEAETVEIMFKHLPLLHEPFADLALTKRDLRLVPNIQKNDELYEVSHLFPNCADRDDLWVVYNESSGEIIANVDSLLRSSVNDYVRRAKERAAKRVKFSLTYIEVDRSVGMNLISLNEADSKMIFKQTGLIQNDKLASFAGNQMKLHLSLRSRSGGVAYMGLSMILKGGYDLEFSTTCNIGEPLILDVGLAEGGRKRVLIAQFSLNDLTGQMIGNRVKPRIEKTGEVPEGVVDVTYQLSGVSELPILLGGDYDILNLISPPSWMDGNEDDVVYDLTKLVKMAGIKFKKNEWIVENQNTEKIYIKASPCARKRFEELRFNISNPGRIASIVTFYEVDSVVGVNGEWDIQTLLLANPELLGRVGSLTLGGERSNMSNDQGYIILDMIFGEDGISVDFVAFIDLNLKGRDIKFETECRMNKGFEVIELGDGADSTKKVVMMVDYKSERFEYSRHK